MAIKLIANIEHSPKAGYIASIDSIKGMVVHGNSPEEVCKELFTSLKVKLAFDYGIDPSDVHEVDEQEAKRLEREFLLKPSSEESCKREINLTLS